MNTRVNKSGDTMTGPLNFAENENMHGYILPSHYFHNLYENNDTVYIHAFPSHPAIARKTHFQFRTANGTSGSWTAHTLNSRGLNTPSITLGGGYIENGSRDVGDAIEGNGGANINIASWFGLGFYSTYEKRYTGTMNLRNGDWRTVGAITANTFYTNDWFRCNDNCGIHWQKWGGGWNMTDSTWIRAYGNKNIYTAGKVKADGGFEGKASSAGWADGAEYSNRAVRVENDYRNMRFHWSGQGGQPTWLWGGNDGENMYVYNPSNFTVSRANTAGRADSAATADNANNLQGKDINFLYRYLGGRNQPTLTPLLIKNSSWQNDNVSGIHGQHSGDIQLRQDYRNFDAIFVVSTDTNHNCLMSHIWERWRLEYLFNNGYKLNILGTEWAYYWIWSAVKLGTNPHPLSTPTLWKIEDKADGVICEIYGLNY